MSLLAFSTIWHYSLLIHHKMGVNNFEPYHIIPYSIMTQYIPKVGELSSQDAYAWPIPSRSSHRDMDIATEIAQENTHGIYARWTTLHSGNHVCSPCHGWADLQLWTPLNHTSDWSGPFCKKGKSMCPNRLPWPRHRNGHSWWFLEMLCAAGHLLEARWNYDELCKKNKKILKIEKMYFVCFVSKRSIFGNNSHHWVCWYLAVLFAHSWPNTSPITRSRSMTVPPKTHGITWNYSNQLWKSPPHDSWQAKIGVDLLVSSTA